jgi:pyridoxine 5'-phosphate synthase PdxJ
VKQAGIHVSLVIDLTQSRMDVSAMMPPNRWEFFDTGEITSVTLSTRR